MVTLVIGGARSGKSRYAQSLACDFARPAYIAPARAEDSEMAARIAAHKRGRGANWLTMEEPLAIADAVERCCRDRDFILVDCLTLWLSNFYWEHRESDEAAIEEGALREISRVASIASAAQIVLVTNEVGCGLVPETPVGRFFRDLQGRVNQTAAALAGRVVQVVAGIPVTIKESK